MIKVIVVSDRAIAMNHQPIANRLSTECCRRRYQWDDFWRGLQYHRADLKYCSPMWSRLYPMLDFSGKPLAGYNDD